MCNGNIALKLAFDKDKKRVSKAMVIMELIILVAVF
jgi:hypothetical protein